MDKKSNKSNNDSFKNIKVTEQEIAEVAKRYTVVSKKKIAAGIIAASILVAGGVGTGTYFAIKAMNNTPGSGDSSGFKDGEVVIDPTKKTEAEISAFNLNDGGDKVGTVTSKDTKIIQDVNVSIGQTKLTKTTEYSVSDPSSNNSQKSKKVITIFKATLAKYKGAILISPVFESSDPTQKYSVTFHSNGADEEIATQIVKKGEKIDNTDGKATPSKNGFEFKGWFKDEGFSEEFRYLESTVESDLNLYAKWDVVEVEGALTYQENEGGTGFIVKGIAVSKVALKGVKVPASFTDSNGKTLPVVGIGKSAFIGCFNLSDITLPDSLTYIDEYAFSGCSSLKSVVIPDNVLSIYKKAFEGCVCLENVKFPSKIKIIEQEAFVSCSKLKKVDLPNSLEYLGDATFNNCYSLNDVKLSNNLNELREGSFENCYSLTSITIPAKISKIGLWCFKNTGLTQEGFTLGDNYSAWTKRDENGDIEETITKDQLFETLMSTRPDFGVTKNSFTLTAKPGFVFKYIGLENDVVLLSIAEDENNLPSGEVTLPSEWHDDELTKDARVIEIEDTGFCDICSKATKLILPSTIKKINPYGIGRFNEESMGEDPNTLTTIEFALKEDGTCDLETICDSGIHSTDTLTTIYSGTYTEGVNNLPEGLKYIEKYGLVGLEKLTNITIPSTVEYMEIGRDDDGYYYTPFSSCIGLTNINVVTENQYYSSKDGILYLKGVNDETNEVNPYHTLALIPQGYTNTSFEFPSDINVEKIGTSSIYRVSNLNSFTIPSSVKYIDPYPAYETPIQTLIINSESIYSMSSEDVYNGQINLLNIPSTINVPNEATVGSFITDNFAKDTSITEHQQFDRSVYYLSGSYDEGFSTPATTFKAGKTYTFICEMNDEERYFYFNEFSIRDGEWQILNVITSDKLVVYLDDEQVDTSDYTVTSGSVDFTQGSLSQVSMGTFKFVVTIGDSDVTNAFATGSIYS